MKLPPATTSNALERSISDQHSNVTSGSRGASQSKALFDTKLTNLNSSMKICA